MWPFNHPIADECYAPRWGPIGRCMDNLLRCACLVSCIPSQFRGTWIHANHKGMGRIWCGYGLGVVQISLQSDDPTLDLRS